MLPPDKPKSEPSPPKATLPRTDAELRAEREAAALRQNLLRRKQQTRARQARKPDEPQT